jgi:hypothetical protein
LNPDRSSCARVTSRGQAGFHFTSTLLPFPEKRHQNFLRSRAPILIAVLRFQFLESGIRKLESRIQRRDPSFMIPISEFWFRGSRLNWIQTIELGFQLSSVFLRRSSRGHNLRQSTMTRKTRAVRSRTIRFTRVVEFPST